MTTTPPLRKVSAKSDLLLSTEHSLCPGCGEPLAMRVILELVEELGVRDRTICVCGIGCYTAFPGIIDVDVLQALHGRAPSVATQRTKTTMATGRVPELHGWPIKIADLLAQIDGAVYVARGSMHTPAAIKWTKQCLRDAFASQLDGRGFSFVEILTMCPTDWYVEPTETPEWVERNFEPTYPLRVLKSP